MLVGVTRSDVKESKRRSTRLANRPKSDLNMEQLATALLMKKCGILEEDKQPDQQTEERFRSQFVAPLIPEKVGSYREAFGLSEAGGVDCLGVLSIHADA